jgi:predicted phage terminase large subunit-like protein
MYRDSLEDFFKAAWKVIEPQTPLKWNWHHSYLCEQLENILFMVKDRQPRVQDTIINVPPSTLKSSLITIVFPVWCWLHSPHLKFITLSYAENLAIIHAVKSRDIIQSDWFKEHFGSVFQLKFDVNKKSEYANDKGGSRIAIGMKGTATGKHADILICDDPLNPKMAASPVQLHEINELWDNTIPTRLTDARTSQKIIVMQRLGVNDLTGHCLNKKEGMYRHICLPAEKSKYVIPHSLESRYVDGLLDPERLSHLVLKSMRVSLGSNNYSGQFAQNPVAEGGNLVRPEWFGRFHLHELEKRLYDAQETITWNVFVDGAYTRDELNCPTSLLVAGLYENDLYIRDVERAWMELPDLVKHIPKVTNRNRMNGTSSIIIEPKASGLSIGQMLRKYTPLNVILDKPPREGKTERLKAKLPFIEGRRVYLEASGGWIDMFIDELKAFPFGEYADITDTLVMAIDRAEGDRAGSTIFGMGVTG